MERLPRARTENSSSRRRLFVVLREVLLLLIVAATGFSPSFPEGVTERAGESPPWAELVWSPEPALIVVSLLLALALPARWRRPIPTLVFVTGLSCATIALTGMQGAFALAVAIVAHAVAFRGQRRLTIVATALAILALVIPMAARLAEGWEVSRIVGAATLIALGAAVGDAVHSRRAYLASLVERAERAERTREAEAQRRVAEERLRIARELHDAAAHQIAVINLQSGAASAALSAGRQGDAERSLAAVRSSAQAVLGEIETLLVVLRSEEDDGGSALAPVQGLAGLAPLLTAFEETGLHVEAEVHLRHALPDAVDIVAFKIVQEALTNAHKHGAGGRATLRIDADETGIALDIANGLRTTAGPTGHGLLGIKERVESVRGTLRIDRGPAVFRIHAFLPSSPEGRTSPDDRNGACV